MRQFRFIALVGFYLSYSAMQVPATPPATGLEGLRSSVAAVDESEVSYAAAPDGSLKETAPTKRIRYSLDEGNRLRSVKTFDADDERPWRSEYQYERDALTEWTGYDKGGAVKWRYTYSYDPRGRLVEETSFAADGTIEWKEIRNYQGDSTGPTTLSQYGASGTLKGSTTFKYDEGGRVVEWTLLHANAVVHKRCRLQYDDRGHLSQETYSDGAQTLYERILYHYDDRDRLVEQTRYDGIGGILGRKKLQYDDHDNIVEESTLEANGGETVLTYEYTYDKKGNWTSRRLLRAKGRSENPGEWEALSKTYRSITYRQE